MAMEAMETLTKSAVLHIMRGRGRGRGKEKEKESEKEKATRAGNSSGNQQTKGLAADFCRVPLLEREKFRNKN